MKKTLLSLTLLFNLGFLQAQELISENFDNVANLSKNGWVLNNQSQFSSIYTWGQGNTITDILGGVEPTTMFDSQAGAPDSYINVNYLCGVQSGVLSNWMFTPSVSLQNGDVISFYSRTKENPTEFADRLELRIGQGTTPTAPNGSNDVGGYTILALTINPNLTTSDYPATWTQYSYIVSGIPTLSPCKIAFRYFVNNGGSGNAAINSDLIGIDTFSVSRTTLGARDFFASNFSIQPNPVVDVLNLTSRNGEALQNVKIIDVNGRIVNEVNTSNLNEINVNVSGLNTGVYFVKVQSESGVGTLKIMKK